MLFYLERRMPSMKQLLHPYGGLVCRDTNFFYYSMLYNWAQIKNSRTQLLTIYNRKRARKNNGANDSAEDTKKSASKYLWLIPALTWFAFRDFPGLLMSTLWSTALTPHREPGWALSCMVVSSPGTGEDGENSSDTWHTQKNTHFTIWTLEV